jgi:uncharacterized damage-inducible protein DinB
MMVTFVAGVTRGADDPKPMAPKSGVRSEMYRNVVHAEKEVEELADAMPPESYAWRPMDGVRSVSEVYAHIADANFEFGEAVGLAKSDTHIKDAEKTYTDKAKVTEYLKASFAYFKSAIANTPDSKLDDSVKVFGGMSTVRSALLSGVTHIHEHLGQSIAYARMNKIVPPWTAREQADEMKKDGK